MSSISRYILIFFIGGIVFFVFAIYYLSNSQKNSAIIKPPVKNSQLFAIDSPLDYNDPNLIVPSITYTIRGTITQVTPLNKNKEITIDKSIKNLPPLIILPSVVFKNTPSGFTQTSLEELKIGEKVTIELLYNIRSKKWFVRSVYIANSTSLEFPTPSINISSSSAK